MKNNYKIKFVLNSNNQLFGVYNDRHSTTFVRIVSFYQWFLLFLRKLKLYWRALVLLWIMFSIVSFSMFGQSKIKGKILDVNGQPLSNACVDVVKNDVVVFTAHTNEKGMYFVDKIRKGSYQIIIYYHTTEKVIPNVTVGQDNIVQMVVKLNKPANTLINTTSVYSQK